MSACGRTFHLFGDAIDLTGIPRDYNTSADDINKFLRDLSQPVQPNITESQHSRLLRPRVPVPRPYVHGCLLSYPNRSQKRRRGTLQTDASATETFSAFWRYGQGDKLVRLALFSTWVQNIATMSAVEREALWQHCWTAALIKGADDGKRPVNHLLIWDCEPRTRPGIPRRRNILRHDQLEFVKLVEKRGKLNYLWVNQDDSLGWQNKCLAYSLLWLQRMVAFGDVRIENKEDSRLKDYVLVTRR